MTHSEIFNAYRQALREVVEKLSGQRRHEKRLTAALAIYTAGGVLPKQDISVDGVEVQSQSHSGRKYHVHPIDGCTCEAQQYDTTGTLCKHAVAAVIYGLMQLRIATTAIEINVIDHQYDEQQRKEQSEKIQTTISEVWN